MGSNSSQTIKTNQKLDPNYFRIWLFAIKNNATILGASDHVNGNPTRPTGSELKKFTLLQSPLKRIIIESLPYEICTELADHNLGGTPKDLFDGITERGILTHDAKPHELPN